MAIEKIAFVYPTLIQPGMLAGRIYPPDISMHLNRRSEKHLVVVTVGMMFNAANKYFTEIDILHDGDSVLPDTQSDNPVEKAFADKVDDEQVLHIYSMFAKSVDLNENGVYHVIAKIYRDQYGEKSGDPITEGECYFYVSHTEDQDQ